MISGRCQAHDEQHTNDVRAAPAISDYITLCRTATPSPVLDEDGPVGASESRRHVPLLAPASSALVVSGNACPVVPFACHYGANLYLARLAGPSQTTLKSCF